MILLCWLLSGLTGFVPVFTGIYSSAEHLDLIRKNSRDCGDLVVNKYFSVFAGIVSFWTPASIMVYVYFKVHSALFSIFRRWRIEASGLFIFDS